MKFDQLIEYNVRNIFFKNHVENETGRLVPDFFLIFRNLFIDAKGLHLSFNVFWIVLCLDILRTKRDF